MGRQLRGHLPRHATVLLPPAEVGLMSDLQRFTDFRNLLPLAKFHIRSTQLTDDLICQMSLLLYF
jgi:hypothetical protein